MPPGLPERPTRHYVSEALLPAWDADDASGFDVEATPDDEAFVPVATSIDNVGAVYPSLVVTFSNETSGGANTYDYLTSAGPGQVRTGSLLVTARAQDRPDGYSAGASDPTVSARDLVVQLVNAAQRATLRRADGEGTDFIMLGSQRASDAPDDETTEPTTRLAQAEIRYAYLRDDT